MKNIKSELSGNGWRVVRYGSYYHIYGVELIKRAKTLCHSYTINRINNTGESYLQCHIDALPVKLAI